MDERTAAAASDDVKKSAKTTEQAKPPRRGRWLKRIGLLFVLLGIFTACAPMILSATILKNGVPKFLVPMVHANVEWSELSLGWLSPLSVKNLKVADEQGQPLLDVQSISSSHPLWALAAHSSNLGTLTIVEPVLHLSLRNDGSNVEDLIAKFSTEPEAKTPDKETASAAVPSVIVEVENARLELEHKESQRKSSLDQINVRLTSTKGGVEELDLKIGQPAEGDQQSANWLHASFGKPVQADAASSQPDEKQAVLRAAHWKLDWIAPGLARVMPKAELSGELNADTSLILTPHEKGMDLDWDGHVSLEKLIVAGIDALKQDKLAFDQVELSGRAATTQGRLAINDLKLSADVGEVSATGDFPMEGFQQKATADLVQSLLSDEDFHIVADIDLKKVAAMLPQTLRIREGIEITGGEIKFQFVGDDSNGARRWSGAAGIIGLTAENNGKTIPWDKPLVARMAAHRDQKAIIVDLMECKSDFLQLKGNGTLDDAKFTATGDLDKLVENLERFVDLGIEQLSGQLQVAGELQRTDDEHVALSSKITLDNFAYEVSKNNTWREKALVLSVNAVGTADTTSGLTRIDSGELHLISGGDACNAKLTQPVDFKSTSPSYAATADVKGNLASWQNRLRPFVAVDSWKLQGTMDLETTVAATPQNVDIKKCSIVFEKFEAEGAGLVIQDPELTFETAGQWDMAAQKWTSAKTTLTGHSLGIDIENVECALGKQGLAKLTGTVDYEVDLKQVSQWMNAAAEKPSYYLVGMLTGKANVTQQDAIMTAKLDSQIEKLVIAGLKTTPEGKSAWEVLWKEPLLKVAASANYDSSADQLALDSSSIDVDGLSVGTKGTMTACSTRQQIDFTGDIAYDWDALVKRFGESLSQHIQLSGKDHRPFSVKGSLASLSSSSAPASHGKTPATQVSLSSTSTASPPASLMDFSGEAGLGWSAANVYGIVAGKGDVSAKLDHGVCQFAPLDFAVNEGKFHLTPTVYLDRDPAVLVLPQEKVIDQVRISPELCHGWLKFILPTLADSAQVEGKFSLDMQGATVPIYTPTTGSVDGKLSVHQVQVRPGPLALKIVSGIDQLQTLISRKPLGDLSKDVWLEMPEQHVPFKLIEGRVHHEGMTFMVKNVIVKTSGSVGLDESIQLIAEVPVKDEWLGSNKIFAPLKGQSVQIPISGTLTNPQLDPRVFSNLTKQMGGSLLEGVIKDQVGDKLDDALSNGLNRFLKGKK